MGWVNGKPPDVGSYWDPVGVEVTRPGQWESLLTSAPTGIQWGGGEVTRPGEWEKPRDLGSYFSTTEDKKKPRIAPGLCESKTNYLRRRNSKTESPPKPNNAIVAGSGIVVTCETPKAVKPEALMFEGGELRLADRLYVNGADQPTAALFAAASAGVAYDAFQAIT